MDAAREGVGHPGLTQTASQPPACGWARSQLKSTQVESHVPVPGPRSGRQAAGPTDAARRTPRLVGRRGMPSAERCGMPHTMTRVRYARITPLWKTVWWTATPPAGLASPGSPPRAAREPGARLEVLQNWSRHGQPKQRAQCKAPINQLHVTGRGRDADSSPLGAACSSEDDGACRRLRTGPGPAAVLCRRQRSPAAQDHQEEARGARNAAAAIATASRHRPARSRAAACPCAGAACI